MKVIKDIAAMREFSTLARKKGLTISLVPTMGYLHRAHMELLKRAKKLGDRLVLSIFVNPTQFGPNEDLGSYPRDLERDLRMAEEAGVDAVFCPLADEVYPPGFQTFVEVTDLGKNLCGMERPGHFRGVATVVLKLFNIIMPHKAIFGLKDFQQFLIIKRLVKDLDLDVEIVGVETVREKDGLAMSSRNEYLKGPEREAARMIPHCLDEAKKAFSGGIRKSSEIIEKVKKIIEKEPLAVIEYVKVCDLDTLEDLDHIEKSALLALAVRIGKARLIDNCILGGTLL